MIAGNKKTSKTLTARQERLAVGISSVLVFWQRRIAMKLNRTLNVMPIARLKAGLLLFCLLVGATFLYLILTSLFFT